MSSKDIERRKDEKTVCTKDDRKEDTTTANRKKRGKEHLFNMSTVRIVPDRNN